MEGWFDGAVVDTGRLPLFSFFVAFVVGFVLIRISVRMIRAGVRWWPGNVRPGGLHVHHVVFGVGMMLAGGMALLLVRDGTGTAVVVAAALFGLGAALVLDEFALLLYLRDVYWCEQGRASVDAVFAAIGLTGALLTGVRPFGWASGALSAHVGETALLVLAAANLAGAVVAVLKGKIWTGLTGVFVPVISLVAAVRLAVPSSPWARRRYPAGSAKMTAAIRRDQRIRRPLIRAKIRVQEFIAGRHDLPADPAAPRGPAAVPD
ncbi:hypothetical protein [Nocardiopsis coralliicola]